MTDVSDFPIIPYTTVPDTSPPNREERERMQALAVASDMRLSQRDSNADTVITDAEKFLTFLRGDPK